MGAGDPWGMPQPRVLRDLVVSSYFVGGGGPRIEVVVEWHRVYFQCICHDIKPAQLLRALDQGMVALCKTAGPVDFKEMGHGVRLAKLKMIHYVR